MEGVDIYDNISQQLIYVSFIQYIPRNMHTVFALMCFVVVAHSLIFPYPSGLLHRHWGNLTIAPVPAKQPWWIWINISCEFIMKDYITTTKQSTTKPCAYFLGYTVRVANESTYNDKCAPIGLQNYGFLKHRQLDCFLTVCSSLHQKRQSSLVLALSLWGVLLRRGTKAETCEHLQELKGISLKHRN